MTARPIVTHEDIQEGTGFSGGGDLVTERQHRSNPSLTPDPQGAPPPPCTPQDPCPAPQTTTEDLRVAHRRQNPAPLHPSLPLQAPEGRGPEGDQAGGREAGWGQEKGIHGTIKPQAPHNPHSAISLTHSQHPPGRGSPPSLRTLPLCRPARSGPFSFHPRPTHPMRHPLNPIPPRSTPSLAPA